MPSLRASLLRQLLQLRRTLTNWDAPVSGLRTQAEWSNRFFRLPHDISVDRFSANGVQVERITPQAISTNGLLLYVHGGGGVLGLGNVHRRLVARICRTATSRALAVDYRLAPEHPFPAQIEDCLEVWRWLLGHDTDPDHIVIAGDSMGANLALSTVSSLKRTGNRLPAAAVCISPLFDLQCRGESFVADDDPAAPRAFASKMARLYAGSEDLDNPLVSPIYSNLRGICPLLLLAGEDELVRSDAQALRDKALVAGVDVEMIVSPGMWHDWILVGHCLLEARQSIEAIGAPLFESVS
jgi:epsilon-lactone hydrolase